MAVLTHAVFRGEDDAAQRILYVGRGDHSLHLGAHHSSRERCKHARACSGWGADSFQRCLSRCTRKALKTQTYARGVIASGIAPGPDDLNVPHRTSVRALPGATIAHNRTESKGDVASESRPGHGASDHPWHPVACTCARPAIPAASRAIPNGAHVIINKFEVRSAGGVDGTARKAS